MTQTHHRIRRPARFFGNRRDDVDHSHPIIPSMTVLAQRRTQGAPGAASRGRSAQARWPVASDNHFAIGTLKPVLGRLTTDSGKGLPGDRASTARREGRHARPERFQQF